MKRPFSHPFLFILGPAAARSARRTLPTSIVRFKLAMIVLKLSLPTAGLGDRVVWHFTAACTGLDIAAAQRARSCVT